MKKIKELMKINFVFAAFNLLSTMLLLKQNLIHSLEHLKKKKNLAQTNLILVETI